MEVVQVLKSKSPKIQSPKDQDISKSHSNTSLTLKKVHLVLLYFGHFIHILQSTKGFSSKLNVPTGGDRTLINDQTNKSEEFLPFSTPASLFFHPNFSLQAAAATGLKMPPLKLSGSVGPMSSLGGRTRKRKRPNSSSSNHSPSQSRRFYKCLGCGSPKRWDRLTDHYRKVDHRSNFNVCF